MRLLKWLERLADWWANEKIVVSRTGLGPYLTRWILFGRRLGRRGGRAVFLHRFHRSDPDDVHDHPWPFVSIIFSGGYFEHVPEAVNNPAGPTVKTWYPPGSVLFRPADWIHRVEVPEGQEAWTLILRGRKVRSWFFHCRSGPMYWKDYIDRLDRGVTHPCAEV